MVVVGEIIINVVFGIVIDVLNVLNLGHRNRTGYEYYGERVSNTPSLHHSKSPYQFLDSRPLIVIYGRRLDGIEPKATAASSMRDWWFKPRTERMLNARLTDLNLSTWNGRTHSNHWLQIFSVPQHHMVRGVLAWERYCCGCCMHPLPTGGTGLLLLFKGQGKGESLLTLCTYPKVPRSNSIQRDTDTLRRILMHGAEIQTRAHSLRIERAETLKRCLLGDPLPAKGIEPPAHHLTRQEQPLSQTDCD